ncbi:unnamed protein product, partial [Heligmosomoides polygyrus]
MGPDGQVLPTDDTGNFIYPAVGPDGSPLPTDESGSVIYPVTKPDGSPLPTDSSGNFVTDEGTIVKKDEEGRPLGPDGQVLPTDDIGNFIYPAVGPDGTPLPTDESGRVIYPVTKPDGSSLPTEASGNFVTDEGTIIKKDEEGRPLGPDGQVLPTSDTGNFIYPVLALGYQEKEHLKEQLRQIAFSEDFSTENIPVDGAVKQQFVMFPRPDSTKIAITVAQGESSFPEEDDDIAHLLLTPQKLADSRAKQIRLENIDASVLSSIIEQYCLSSPGKIHQASQEKVVQQPKKAAESSSEKKEDSKPLGPDGQVLPTDDSGNYIYPAVG